MLIDITTLLAGMISETSKKEWSKKIEVWYTRNFKGAKEVTKSSEGDILLEPTLARRYIVSARSIKSSYKEPLIIEVDKEEAKHQKELLDSIKTQNSKYENEFHSIYKFSTWEETYKEIIEDFNSNDDTLKTIFKWTYGITYFSRFSSVRSRLTEIRKKIENSNLENSKKELILKYLVLPKNINDEIDSRVDKESTKRAKNSDIEKIQVSEVKKLIEATIKTIKGYFRLLDSNSNFKLGRKSRKYIRKSEIGKKEGIANLMLFLTLTTGRRPIELLKLSEFTKKSDHLLEVKNLAKKRDNESELVIPILFSNSDLVLKAIDFLRDNIDSATLRSSETSITKRLYAYVNDDWEGLTPKWLQTDGDKFKKCRAVYALTFEALINQTVESLKISQAGYLSKLLGHDEDDISTQNSYYKASILIGRFSKDKYLDSVSDIIEFMKLEKEIKEKEKESQN
jgi:hypothetical protein